MMDFFTDPDGIEPEATLVNSFQKGPMEDFGLNLLN